MAVSSPIGKENNSSEEFDNPMTMTNRGKLAVPKKTIEASELLAKQYSHARGRGLRSLSGDDGTTPFRRKASDMKYSSISPPESRVPSAKTISRQCFPGASSMSMSSSSPESLLVEDSHDEGERRRESCPLDEDQNSPGSRAIKAEMEHIIESSPIPKSYLNSPPKRSPVLPDIKLSKAGVAKKSMEASDLLRMTGQRGGAQTKGGKARSGRAAKGPSTTGFAATKAAYGGGRAPPKRNSSVPRRLSSADASSRTKNERNGRQGREAFTAPNAGGVAKSLEWDLQQEKPARSAGVARVSSKKKPVPLAVRRERQQRKERLKEAKCAPKNEVNGRRNLDKRTARLRFADSFKTDIESTRQRQTHLNDGSNHSDKTGSQMQDRGVNGGVSIMVRKRPIFDYELDRGDYDVVSIDNTTGSSPLDKVTIHNAIMHADMKQMLMKPLHYPVTGAFDEHASDDDVYRHIAEPLVFDAADGGVATILMYGQTGSGKSHTMSGIETRTAHGLFQALESKFGNDDQPVVQLQFVELCGSKECKDLLVKKSADVKLADDEDGSVRLVNAASIEVTCPEELMARIVLCKGRRATEATDKNGVSSRSHAVCQIQIIAGKRRGVLTLIDCAGSERRHDSMYHSSERQKESAEINASLYALKECIRARANQAPRIPFRSSNLTRILKESFERGGARLCVIACVAPNATDTEHTMETLKTVASIVGVDDQIEEEKAHAVAPQTHEASRPAILPPKQWDHERLKRFLAHKKISGVQLSEKHDGKVLMKMSVQQMRTQLFDGGEYKDQAKGLFDALRTESDRVDRILKKARADLKEQRKLREAI